MWIFVQSTGRMWHAHAGGKVVLEIGYAARGKGENNPEMQFAEDCGPLPQGRYRLQEPETWHNMSHCFHLDPAPGNAMGGRCGFLIHAGMRDGSPRPRMAASSCPSMHGRRSPPATTATCWCSATIRRADRGKARAPEHVKVL